MLLGALVGIVGGVAAAAVEWGLHHGSELLVGRAAHDAMYSGRTFVFLDSERGRWEALAILLLPAMGGLISGLLMSWLCPNVVGHGTGMFINAFHRHLGRLDPKVPFVKMGAAVVVISAGGSTGPEGPVAGMGAAIGSWFGKTFKLTPRERRTLLVAGCAAGVGAIFRCPLGGALFAATILYREPDVESDAFIPSFMASVLGYSVFTAFWGAGVHLLDGADRLLFASFTDLLPYALLGPLCGLLSIFYVLCVRTVEERLRPASRLPAWLSPAVGGLLTGAIACCLPQVMDGRYEFIQAAVNGGKEATEAASGGIEGLFVQRPEMTPWAWAGLFAAVAVFKCIATGFTVGSGASGGLLGPSVFIGGVAGAFLGACFEAAAPGLIDEDLRKSLIAAGMAGVLAAAMRTPLAAIVMLTEMTGSLGLVAPLMLVCVSSYLVGRRFGAHEEQLRSASESPAHAADPIVRLLESGRVSQLMERPWPAVVPPDATLGDLVAQMKSGTRPVVAVVREGQLEGLISLADIRAITGEDGLAEALIASDIMTRELCTVYDDDTLYAALEEFKRFHHDVIPVLSRGPRSQWLGMLTRQRVYEAVRNQIADVQQSVLTEHAGLAMIHHEGQIAELMLGVAPMHKDRIQRMPVPLQAVGQSLREADFARRFGAQVVGIQDEKGEIHCPPDIDKPLRPDYELIAIVFAASGEAPPT